MKVTLRKIESNHDMLSRDVYTGTAMALPQLGESFVMETREEGMLWTTPVLEIIKLPGYYSVLRFRTKNSTYELAVDK